MLTTHTQCKVSTHAVPVFSGTANADPSNSPLLYAPLLDYLTPGSPLGYATVQTIIVTKFDTMYTFACGCGKKFSRLKADLAERKTVLHCGCKGGNTKHEMSRVRGYLKWHDMIGKCTSSMHKQYEQFGGMGVSVCKEWLPPGGLFRFLNEMGHPEEDEQLVLREGAKVFSKETCAWVVGGQEVTRHDRIIVQYQGKKMTLVELSDRLKRRYQEVYRWYRRHGGVMEGLTAEA